MIVDFWSNSDHKSKIIADRRLAHGDHGIAA